MTQVSYDSRALTINGERTLLISGAIHYPRSTPAQWPQIMQRSREAGLTCIETYVFWNLHEPKRGVYDFSDRLDIRRFCQLAQEHGLNVVLRIGPYICAEINYGGFPSWLRDVPGLQTRTLNQPFMAEMERWVRFVAGYLKDLFAPNGGPIIAAQIENEYDLVGASYGEEGQRYQQWAIDLGHSLNLGVPWIMCVGGAEGALETINGFYGHTFLERHWNDHPEQPAIWTEDWTGWYDTWGFPHHVRTPEDEAYAAARFIAAGGTGINYYMWHGGTNFGREAMYLQTTSYDYDAPLDEFGFPTTKSQHLARLNNLLHHYAPVLLGNGRPKAQVLGPDHVAFKYGKLEFLCNDGETPWPMGSFTLPPRSVAIAEGGKVQWISSAVEPAAVVTRRYIETEVQPQGWAWHAEPLPDQRPEPPVVADRPVEQLSLTHDQSDYTWYTTRITAEGGEATLTLEGVGDWVYIYVDGRLVSHTAGVIKEDRGPLDGDGFAQNFKFSLEPGEHQLSILCCALGLIKGDWMIGMANMVQERKGLWGRALLNGAELTGPWSMHPGTVGESAGFMGYTGRLLEWSAEAQAAVGRPLTWWRASFARPDAVDGGLALDMGSMTKGLVWVNGRCLGRYWLVAGTGQTPVWLVPPVEDSGVGEPTQRYYHLPVDWLQAQNEIVVLEEAGGDPAGVRLCVKR